MDSLIATLARPEGVEPPTLGSEVRCSIQLSYGRSILKTGPEQPLVLPKRAQYTNQISILQTEIIVTACSCAANNFLFSDVHSGNKRKSPSGNGKATFRLLHQSGAVILMGR